MLRARPHGPVTRLVMARTALGRPLYTVAAYRFGRVLVDTGLRHTSRELLAWLREVGGELGAVVLTHHHEDHAGGAALLARELGVPVYAPPATVERLAHRHALPFYRRVTWGVTEPCPAIPLGEVFEAEGVRWQVVETPGHAFDHVVLFDAERGWMFSGDLFVHERAQYVRRIEDPWQHLASIERAVALEPERLFCAHGGVVDDATEALRRKAAYWRELAEHALDLADRGLPHRAVTRRLLGREGALYYLSFRDFAKRNLISKLIAGAASRRAAASGR